MEKDLNSGTSEKWRKSKTYFIIGYVFLMAMALFWSVDSSIVLILFSIACYFLFLGFYARPSTQKKYDESYKSPGGFADTFKNVIQKKPAAPKYTARPGAASATPEAQRRIVLAIVMAVFAVFFVFFVGSIFFGSSERLDEDVAYFQQAEQFYWSGNYDSASINYRRAMRANDQSAEALEGYGRVLTARDQPDSAIIMFDKALAIDPQYSRATYGKALIYFNQERNDESISLLAPVLEENPEYYDAMLLIGDCYFAQKKYDDALSWYSNAYENGGIRSQPLCYRLAYLYDEKGNYPIAIDLYKETLTYDTTVVDIYTRLGELLPNEDGNYYRTQAVRLQQSN
jgi:predicted Zn-dependent protease